MDFSNVGFVIDSVGDEAAEENASGNSAVSDVFNQFFQKEATTNMHKILASPDKPKLNTYEQMLKDVKALIPQTNTPSNKHKKNKAKHKPSLKVDIEEFKNNKDIGKLLEKSAVLQPGFEELQTVPSQAVSDKRLKLQRKIEREKTKGSKWFNMPATEVTEDLKNDLKVLQMRSVLDPKHFYKKNDLKVLPKYFQVGKVMDSPLDFYNNRLTKKERKKTLVDELLADAEFTKYNKKKYTEVLVEKQKTHYKAYMQAKRLKRKNKK